jgi:hypothetical protein
MGWCIRGIILKERGQKEVEWKEGKFSGEKGREALLQALQERGHDEDHFWKLHPEKRPKWFK